MGGGDDLVPQAEGQQEFGIGLGDAHHPLGALVKGLGIGFSVFIVGGDGDGIMGFRRRGLRHGRRGGSGALGGLPAAGGQAERQSQDKEQGYRFFHIHTPSLY